MQNGKEIEHMLGLDHCTQAVQVVGYFSKEIFC